MDFTAGLELEIGTASTGMKRGQKFDDVRQELKSAKTVSVEGTNTESGQFIADYLKADSKKTSTNISNMIHSKINTYGEDSKTLPKSVMDMIYAHIQPSDFGIMSQVWPNVPLPTEADLAKSTAVKSRYYPIETHFVADFLRLIQSESLSTEAVEKALTNYYTDAVLRKDVEATVNENTKIIKEINFDMESGKAIEAVRSNFFRAVIANSTLKFSSLMFGGKATKEFLFGISGEGYDGKDGMTVNLRDNPYFKEIASTGGKIYNVKPEYKAPYPQSSPFGEAPKLSFLYKLGHLLHTIIDCENNEKMIAIFLDFITSRLEIGQIPQKKIEFKKSDEFKPIEKNLSKLFVCNSPTTSKLNLEFIMKCLKLDNDGLVKLVSEMNIIREMNAEVFAKYLENPNFVYPAAEVDALIASGEFKHNTNNIVNKCMILENLREAIKGGLGGNLLKLFNESKTFSYEVAEYMNFANTDFLKAGRITSANGIIHDVRRDVTKSSFLSFSNRIRDVLYSKTIYTNSKRINMFFYSDIDQAGNKTANFEDAYAAFEAAYMDSDNPKSKYPYNLPCAEYSSQVDTRNLNPGAPPLSIIMTSIYKLPYTKKDDEYVTLPREDIVTISKSTPFILTESFFIKNEETFQGDKFARMMANPVHASLCYDGSQGSQKTSKVDITTSRPSKVSFGKFAEGNVSVKSNLKSIGIHAYVFPDDN